LAVEARRSQRSGVALAVPRIVQGVSVSLSLLLSFSMLYLSSSLLWVFGPGEWLPGSRAPLGISGCSGFVEKKFRSPARGSHLLPAASGGQNSP
jgi:hypothetical protein